jgi:hypothetical protein
VLAWPDESKLKLKDTQRLQLASKQGRTLTCLFRPDAAHKHSSMAELRLALKSAAPGEVRLDILKRRGGWPLEDLCMPAADLTASKHATPAVIQEQLELWRATQETIEQTQQQKYKLERKPDVHHQQLLEHVTGAFIPAPAPAKPTVRMH